MELINHPRRFGNTVRSIRKKKHMNQIEFYKYLFPDTDKEDENIKKKMNKIENGKQSSVDFDFFLALCHKCDVSSDYLIGKDSYENFDIKQVCEYTGLSEAAVKQLHKWQTDANNGADLSIIGNVVVGDDGDIKMHQAYNKQFALEYLKILNYLFTEIDTKETIFGETKKIRCSNIGVLNSLHTLCIKEPKKIVGTPIMGETFEGYEDFLFKMHPHLKTVLERVTIDASSTVILQDDSEIWYPLDVKSIIEQIGRRHLDKSIDRLIDTIKNDKQQLL